MKQDEKKLWASTLQNDIDFFEKCLCSGNKSVANPQISQIRVMKKPGGLK